MNLNTIPESKEDVMIMSTEDFNKRMYANFADNIKSILSAHNYFLAEYKAKQHFRKFTDFTEAMEYVTSMCPKGTDAMYQMYESVANTLNFKHSMTIYIQDKETFANDCSEGCTTVVVHGDDTHWHVPSSLPRIVAARMRKAMKHGYENILFEYYPRYVHTANPDTGLVNSYPDVECIDTTDAVDEVPEPMSQGLKQGELSMVAGLASGHNAQEHTRQLLGRLKSQSVQITMESDSSLDNGSIDLYKNTPVFGTHEPMFVTDDESK